MIRTTMPRRVLSLTLCIFAVASATASCTRNEPHIITRYPVTATYSGPAEGGRTEGALSLDVHLVDCAGDARLEIGDGCSLHGSWATADYGIDDDNRLWHRGILLLDSSQLCTLRLRRGTATLRVSNGVAKLGDAHVIEVTVGGEVTAGATAASQATLSFTAAPVGPRPDARCQ